jgi:hypothetical protein
MSNIGVFADFFLLCFVDFFFYGEFLVAVMFVVGLLGDF